MVKSPLRGFKLRFAQREGRACRGRGAKIKSPLRGFKWLSRPTAFKWLNRRYAALSCVSRNGRAALVAAEGGERTRRSASLPLFGNSFFTYTVHGLSDDLS